MYIRILPIVFFIGVVFNVFEFVKSMKGMSSNHEVNIIRITQMRAHFIGAIWDFIFMLILLP
jgi:heme/copper-type cytochrome/quinol oxidase subunit 3